MKKALAMILALVMVFALAACNEERLLKYYHQMNRQGKEIALAQVQVLAESGKF